MSTYCLATATYSIEQYCRRRLLSKLFHEWVESSGELSVPLREYPVSEILAVYAVYRFNQPDSVEPELYRLEPDCGSFENIPYYIVFSPAVKRLRGLSGFKVAYSAGYCPGDVPPDLGSACLELAAWNYGRFKGRRIGFTGAVWGTGKNGEHFEAAMPENVRLLLEPYKRVMI